MVSLVNLAGKNRDLSCYTIFLYIFDHEANKISVITLHAYARSKVISLSVICRLSSTRKSPDLNIQASLWSVSMIKQSKVAKNSSFCFLMLSACHECYKSYVYVGHAHWPHLVIPCIDTTAQCDKDVIEIAYIVCTDPACRVCALQSSSLTNFFFLFTFALQYVACSRRMASAS